MALYQCGLLFSGQGGESEDGGRDRAESGGWIDLGKEEKQQLVSRGIYSANTMYLEGGRGGGTRGIRPDKIEEKK